MHKAIFNSSNFDSYKRQISKAVITDCGLGALKPPQALISLSEKNIAIACTELWFVLCRQLEKNYRLVGILEHRTYRDNSVLRGGGGGRERA